MSKTKSITLPDPGDLSLPIADVLCKLPTEALHNQLHQLGERAKAGRANLEATEISALILCALELEHQQKVQRVGPWKKWVKENCDFSYSSAANYNRVLKAARLGAIDGLLPESIPETAPSLMSKDQLTDACATLAASLQGLGGIRQLYIKLDIISLPSVTPDGEPTIKKNQNTKGSPQKTADTDASAALTTREKDALTAYRSAVADLDQAEKIEHYQNLPSGSLDELIDGLTHHLSLLTNLK